MVEIELGSFYGDGSDGDNVVELCLKVVKSLAFRRGAYFFKDSRLGLVNEIAE